MIIVQQKTKIIVQQKRKLLSNKRQRLTQSLTLSSKLISSKYPTNLERILDRL
jgi:hypothetical protein